MLRAGGSLFLAGILQHTYSLGVLIFVCGWYRVSALMMFVCVCPLKQNRTRSSQLSSIIYNSLPFSTAITPHFLSLQPFLSRPPPTPLLLQHCLSPVMLLSILLNNLFDVILLSFIRQRYGGIFFPWGFFSLALHATVMCISLTPADETGALQSHAGFDWTPVWQQRDFSSGCWVRRPCSVISMQVFILPNVRLEFLLDG